MILFFVHNNARWKATPFGLLVGRFYLLTIFDHHDHYDDIMLDYVDGLVDMVGLSGHQPL